MHHSSELPLVDINDKMSDILLEITSKHFGCCGVTENGELVGIITDGDLRRAIKKSEIIILAAQLLGKKLFLIINCGKVFVRARMLAN